MPSPLLSSYIFPLLWSPLLTLPLHFISLSYHTTPCSFSPHPIWSYVILLHLLLQLLLYRIFNFTSINLVPHLPPSYPFLSYLMLTFMLSLPMLSHFSSFLIPPHSIPFFLPYFIPSHPGLSYLIPCLTLLYTISFYPILPHLPHFPQPHPYLVPSYSASSSFISLTTLFHFISFYPILPHPSPFPTSFYLVPPHPT